MPKTKQQKAKQKTSLVKYGGVNYPIGDFLIRVKNAALAGRKDVLARDTKLVYSVAQALKRAGYLEKVVKKDGIVLVSLSFKKKRPLLLDIHLVSKPGLRVYKSVEEVEGKKGPSTLLLSTPNGILTSKEAVQKRAAGEVLAEVL